MTPTICGHERDALIWALKHFDMQIVFERRKRAPESAALVAIDDPAKLAELMAMAIKARGIVALAAHEYRFWDVYNSVPGIPDWMFLYSDRHGGIREIEIIKHGTSNVSHWGMPQARAKLLAIMQTLPDESSRDACEKILRGDT